MKLPKLSFWQYTFKNHPIQLIFLAIIAVSMFLDFNTWAGSPFVNWSILIIFGMVIPIVIGINLVRDYKRYCKRMDKYNSND